MADMMQWFAVGCPSCAIHLQVKLPEGITSVQCSECKAVFAVQIQPATLATVPQPGSSKKSRKRSSTDKDDKKAPPRPLSAYNLFMKTEVTKVKGEHPELVHRDAFKMVSAAPPKALRAPGRVNPSRFTQPSNATSPRLCRLRSAGRCHQ